MMMIGFGMHIGVKCTHKQQLLLILHDCLYSGTVT